jgi:elongation factor P
MIDVTQLKPGRTFEQGDDILKVLDYEHRKQGRGKATIRVKVRNVRTGSSYEITFNSGERVQDVRLEKREFEYLYDDGHFYVFMDSDTYAQKFVTRELLGDDAKFLVENMVINLLTYEDEVIDYEFPSSVELEVVSAENAVAGDTATGATKEIVTQSGLKVKTPLFVNEGDVIRVNTQTGEYITRV